MRSRACALIPWLVSSIFWLGCSSDEEPSVDEPAPEVAWPNLVCDPIAPEYCAYPWPSNVYTVSDESSPTGLRVSLSPEGMPRDNYDQLNEVDRWGHADGFSTNASILTQLPRAVDEGLAIADRIERSLEEDSPTVLLNAETGERVLHIAELDYSTDDPDERSLIITPGHRLESSTRYIVAIRNVENDAGEVIPASPAFRALRDLRPYDEDDSVDERRPLYADIFSRLENAGVERGELQMAWDFTTMSVENTTEAMLHMRDEGLGGGEIDYEVTDVQADWVPGEIAYRVAGTVRVPDYLTDRDWPGELQLGDDGLPEQVGETDVPFLLLIPEAANDEPVALLQYGHGLLWKKEQILDEHFVPLMNEHGYAMFSVNWIGMSEEDELPIANVLNEGRLNDIGVMVDRLHQGSLDQLALMRAMSTTFGDDPMFGELIDPNERYYHGISQGGILGAVYMALTTDVERGVLGVMGQPYSLLLMRSVQFDRFFLVVRSTWKDARDVQMVLNLVAQLWERLEPAGYSEHIRRDTLPGTPEHEVLMRAALGDHQVTTIAAHIMARTVDAPHLDTGLRDVHGLEMRSGPIEGSAYVEYDFGLPPDPVCNVPQNLCDDPHGNIRRLEDARLQLDHFLRNGEVDNFCDGGECSFPEQSGCIGGENNDDVCAP